MKRRILGTTHRGKRKIYSRKQMKFFHAQHIDHTHIDKHGRKKRHIY